MFIPDKIDLNTQVWLPVAQRWSNRAFSDQPLSAEQVAIVFEAARWSPSSYNEQPWRFFGAHQHQTVQFDKLVKLLVPFNRDWAPKAPFLGLACAVQHFSKNNKPNRHAPQDLGIALGAMTLQAAALGFQMHCMGGFELEQAKATLMLPENWQPYTMFTLGYPGHVATLPTDLQPDEQAPRHRKPLSEIFNNSF